MAKRTTKGKGNWVSKKELNKSIKKQNQMLSSCVSDTKFNPHVYFGGWNEIERSSIDKIQCDQRLKYMMEYETSNASMSAC